MTADDPTSRNPTYFPGDLHRALLDAAAQAVDELGPAGVSLREVARRVGVSHAAPAHHFGDKAGLFTALATEGFDALRKAIGAVVARDPDGADRAVLVEAGVAYVRFATTHRGHFEVMWRGDLLRTDDPRYLQAAADAFGVLVEAVRVHQAAGWAPGRNPRELTLASWAMVHGLAALHNAGALAVVAGDPPDVIARAVVAIHTDALEAADPTR